VREEVFRPLAEGGRPAGATLLALREAERGALAHATLAPSEVGYGWSWEAEPDLRAPLWAFTHRAVDLLTNGPLQRLKVCHRCRWLFLDVSKNRSRRWCSMEGCGTDDKKERYVARRRARRGDR
jgi:predicted RNA-binding Zn ribbon-like protein